MINNKFITIGVIAVLIFSASWSDASALSSPLQYGDRGPWVTELQQALKNQGYFDNEVTGYFGPVTQAAVIKFQKANGISPAVGYFGPLTLAKLKSGANIPSNLVVGPSAPAPFPNPKNTITKDELDAISSRSSFSIPGPVGTKFHGPWEDPSLHCAPYNLIAVSPSDANVIYISSSFGDSNCGTYRSIDGGQTWRLAMGSGSELPHLYLDGDYYRAITAISVAPSNPNVIYAGTNAADNGSIYRSVDGGENFSNVGGSQSLGLFARKISGGISSIAIDQKNSDIVYVGVVKNSGPGLVGKMYKSSDGGVDWKEIYSGGVNDVFFIVTDPSNSNVIYAYTRNVTKAELEIGSLGGIQYAGTWSYLYRSVDQGNTWNTVLLESPAVITDVSLDPFNNSILYISTSPSVLVIPLLPILSGKDDILRSTNDGNNWSPLNTNLLPTAIATDPSIPDRLYVASVNPPGIFYSTAGKEWKQLNTQNNIQLPSLLFPQHLYINAAKRVLYAPTSDGIYVIKLAEDDGLVKSSNTLTPQQEVDIGKNLKNNLIKYGGYTEDTNQHSKTQAVWARLAVVAEKIEKARFGRNSSWRDFGGWQLSIMDLKDAGKSHPTRSFMGGIIILDPRFAELPEDQIAFLLAHEMFHAQSNLPNTRVSLDGLVEINLGGVWITGFCIIGHVVAPVVGCGPGAKVGGGVAKTIAMLANKWIDYLNEATRENERSADNFGVAYLSTAGFNVERSLDYLKSRASNEWGYVGYWNDLFSEDPSFRSRLEGILIPTPSQSLNVSLSTNPSSVTAGQSVSLTADVSGTAQGTIHYQFDCTNNGGHEVDVVNNTDPYTTTSCNYSSPGTYTAKVHVERGSAPPAEKTISITVTALTPPVPATCILTRDLYQGISGNDVLCLQRYLNSSGFRIAASGQGSPGNETNYFGSLTAKAVSNWQIANNISPSSGYFDAFSRAKFNATPVLTIPQPQTPTTIDNAPFSAIEQRLRSGSSDYGKFYVYIGVQNCGNCIGVKGVSMEKDAAEKLARELSPNFLGYFQQRTIDFDADYRPEAIEAMMLLAQEKGLIPRASIKEGYYDGNGEFWSSDLWNKQNSAPTPIPTPNPTPIISPAPTSVLPIPVPAPQQTLVVSILVDPLNGTAPLNNVSVKASVFGTAIGTVNYTFYCNRSDSGTNITAGWNAKFDGISDESKTAVCNYPNPGTYTVKVIAERGSAPPAEVRMPINVTSQPTPVTPPTSSSGDGGGGSIGTTTPTNTVITNPILSLGPTSGQKGTRFTFAGSGFKPGGIIQEIVTKPDGTRYVPIYLTANAQGSATKTYDSSTASIFGTYSIYWIDQATGKQSNTVQETISAY